MHTLERRVLLAGRCVNYQAKLREKVIQALGGRCCSFNCHWQNEDGTLGCDDPRVLQLDHPNGGGSKDRKLRTWSQIYKDALENPCNYNLLCANCNWIKRVERREATGNPHNHIEIKGR